MTDTFPTELINHEYRSTYDRDLDNMSVVLREITNFRKYYGDKTKSFFTFFIRIEQTFDFISYEMKRLYYAESARTVSNKRLGPNEASPLLALALSETVTR